MLARSAVISDGHISSVLKMFGPPNLPTQIELLLKEMTAIRVAAEALAAAQADQSPDTPDVEARMVSIGSIGPSSWQTSEQMRIIGIILTSDTLGRYGLTMGNDTSRWWRINSSEPVNLGFSPERRLVVPRGLALTFSVPAGAAWDANIWWLPGTAEGAVS